MLLSLNPIVRRDAVELLHQGTLSWNSIVSDAERSIRGFCQRGEPQRENQEDFEKMQQQQRYNHHHQQQHLMAKLSDHQAAFSVMPSSPNVSDDEEALTAIMSLIEAMQRIEAPSVSANENPGDARVDVVPEAGGGERYKTELCRAYEERGQCRYADKCQFAHGLNDLRTVDRHPKYKTELCRTFHSTGFCPYGARCHFVHNDSPCCGGETSSSTADVSTSPKDDENANPRYHQQLVMARRQLATLCTERLSQSSDDGKPDALRSPRNVTLASSSSLPSVVCSVGKPIPSTQNTGLKTTTAHSKSFCRTEDVGSILLQHRRRQNLVTLSLNQSPSSCPVWMMAPPNGLQQCRPSPPLSSADSGLYSRGSSTGSPTMSEVFSPTSSPIPPQMVPASFSSTPDFTRPPPSVSATTSSCVTPMFDCSVPSGLDWSPAYSPAAQLSAHRIPTSASLFTDPSSRRFFGFAGELMVSR